MNTTNFIHISKMNREQTKNVCEKFYNSAKEYTLRNNIPNQSDKILDQTDSVLSKFLSAGVNLEFLWQIHYLKKDKYSEQKHTTEWENNISFTDYIFMENFIIQAKAYLDYSKRLAFIVLGLDKKVKNRTYFHETLSELQSDKANSINQYFLKIYEEGRWANQINKIRNKIIHNEVHKTWSLDKPKIDNSEYQQYCQNTENGMFELLTKMQELFFEKKWKAGY